MNKKQDKTNKLKKTKKENPRLPEKSLQKVEKEEPSLESILLKTKLKIVKDLNKTKSTSSPIDKISIPLNTKEQKSTSIDEAPKSNEKESISTAQVTQRENETNRQAIQNSQTANQDYIRANEDSSRINREIYDSQFSKERDDVSAYRSKRSTYMRTTNPLEESKKYDAMTGRLNNLNRPIIDPHPQSATSETSSLFQKKIIIDTETPGNEYYDILKQDESKPKRRYPWERA